MIIEITNHINSGAYLDESQTYELMNHISEGRFSLDDIVQFLDALSSRLVSKDELLGFRNALTELCLQVDLGTENIDIVGTGGDGKNTFNISTTSAFVIAGAGYNVAKHGNYGVSSISGSANVLQHLGVEFTSSEDKLKTFIDKAGICFLHAPLFHPAMKEVGPARKKLGKKTVFNILGPLVNPSLAAKMVTGVYDASILPLYDHVLNKAGVTYAVLYAEDGYDEVSLTSKVYTYKNSGKALLATEEFGLATIMPEELYGGDTIKDAAAILTSVLANTCSEAQKNVVLANAALGIQLYNQSLSLIDCVAMARQSIESGEAQKSLHTLIELSQ